MIYGEKYKDNVTWVLWKVFFLKAWDTEYTTFDFSLFN